jgi:hypothetical protein
VGHVAAIEPGGAAELGLVDEPARAVARAPADLGGQDRECARRIQDVLRRRAEAWLDSDG